MKPGWRIALLCAIALAIAAAAWPSGVSGGAEDAPDPEPVVRLSHESGFYDEPFLLEMQCDEGEIYYTLDCSAPDEDSLLYTGPLQIEDASAHENVYSAIEEVCLDLKPEILAGEGMAPVYGNTVPQNPVDKATVVRAVCVDALGKRSGETIGVYFVGFGEKKAYDGMGIIAISTDPGNLFDYEQGIYVLGKTFDEANPAKFNKKKKTYYRFWPANYVNKGKDWEREAHICFFDGERKLIASGSYGIRIQGQGSRGLLPKSLNLYARKRYGAESFPAKALLGVDYPLNHLNLSSGGDNMSTMLADYLANTVAANLKFDTREYVPYQMFLDGEYWGVYWLTPRYKEDYFEGRYGLSGKDVIEINSNGIQVGRKGDKKLYRAMVDSIAEGDMSDPEQYARACELIDIESCIDYYATEIYLSNVDWPKKNRAQWRSREISDAPYADGKWRWMLYDVSFAMLPERGKTDTLQQAAGQDEMFCSLLDSEAFETALCARLVELGRDTFNPEKMEAFIAEYIDRMADAMENEYSRFFEGVKTREDFVEGCQNASAFFSKRYDYIMKKYGAAYG